VGAAALAELLEPPRNLEVGAAAELLCSSGQSSPPVGAPSTSLSAPGEPLGVVALRARPASLEEMVAYRARPTRPAEPAHGFPLAREEKVGSLGLPLEGEPTQAASQRSLSPVKLTLDRAA
jgi:hypothetical protein